MWGLGDQFSCLNWSTGLEWGFLNSLLTREWSRVRNFWLTLFHFKRLTKGRNWGKNGAKISRVWNLSLCSSDFLSIFNLSVLLHFSPHACLLRWFLVHASEAPYQIDCSCILWVSLEAVWCTLLLEMIRISCWLVKWSFLYFSFFPTVSFHWTSLSAAPSSSLHFLTGMSFTHIGKASWSLLQAEQFQISHLLRESSKLKESFKVTQSNHQPSIACNH